MEEFLNSGPLNLTYAGVLGISFIFALISLIGSEVGDAFDFDADVDGGAKSTLPTLAPSQWRCLVPHLVSQV